MVLAPGGLATNGGSGGMRRRRITGIVLGGGPRCIFGVVGSSMKVAIRFVSRAFLTVFELESSRFCTAL